MVRSMVNLIPSMKGADGEDCLHFGCHIDEAFADMQGQRVFQPLEDSFDVIRSAIPVAKKFGPEASINMLQKPIEDFINQLLKNKDTIPPTIPAFADTLYVRNKQIIAAESAVQSTSRERVLAAREYADIRIGKYRQLVGEARQKMWDAFYHQFLQDHPSGA